VAKAARLSQELSIPIQLYCNQNTSKAVEILFRKLKFTATLHPNIFDDWDDILILSRNIHADDLLILVSSRKEGISFLPALENFPEKLQKYFPSVSKVIVYPQQFVQDYESSDYEAPVEPLSKSLETIQRFTKGIGNIFKKED
jgi:hypothetical protein